MSLILDALNKADNERRQDDAPSIDSNHDMPLPGHRSDGLDPRLTWGAGVIALIAIAILAIWILRPSTVPQTDSQNIADRSAPETAAPAQASTPQADNIPPHTNEAAQRRLIAAQYAQQQKHTQNVEPQAIEPRPTADDSTLASRDTVEFAKQDTAIAAIYEQAKATPVPTAVPPTPTAIPQAAIRSAPAPKPTRKPRPKIDISMRLAKYPELQFIHDLAYSAQKSIPTMMYTGHRFRATPPFVKINNREFKAGDQVAKDVVLEEILSDGIVMRHKSLRFKVLAMNSWINM